MDPKFKTPEEAAAYMEGNERAVVQLIGANPEGVLQSMRRFPDFAQDFLNSHMRTPSAPAPIGSAPPPPPPPPMSLPPPPPCPTVVGNGEGFENSLRMAFEKRSAKPKDIDQLLEEEKKSTKLPSANPIGANHLVELKKALEAKKEGAPPRKSIDETVRENKQASVTNQSDVGQALLRAVRMSKSEETGVAPLDDVSEKASAEKFKGGFLQAARKAESEETGVASLADVSEEEPEEAVSKFESLRMKFENGSRGGVPKPVQQGLKRRPSRKMVRKSSVRRVTQNVAKEDLEAASEGRASDAGPSGSSGPSAENHDENVPQNKEDKKKKKSSGLGFKTFFGKFGKKK
ncbi:hypothetical protein CAEBREN_16200 [Caenorhabditis brenneri]|uniref:Uncharacterized protein n=1 Tax=Caenorhabditis brenneri TaxID=135651 RepID=G0N1Y9_CAEBE|nr:hypothetical protein CAEBREN_16200 [Caenorhabditis brenneri]